MGLARPPAASTAGSASGCSRLRAVMLRVLLPLLGTTALVASFVLPPLPSTAQADCPGRHREASTRRVSRAATPTSSGEKEDLLARWSLGEAVDEELLELARREALATDADWYRTVIGGAPSTEVVDAPAAATTASTAVPSTPAPAPAPAPTEVLDPTARKLLVLGYSQEEARGLPSDIASVIVESGIRRPEGPLPAEWLSEDAGVEAGADGGEGEEDGYGEGEEEDGEYRRSPPRSRRRAAAAGGRGGARARDAAPPAWASARRRRSAAAAGAGRSIRSRRAIYHDDDEEEGDPFLDEEEEEGLDEEERAYRRGLQAPINRGRPDFEGEDDDFGPTFTEQEPGLLPLLLDQVTAQIRASPVLRPLLREDRFKYLLSQEADLRLLVTGSWAADMLRDEYRWRLGLFRDYLKVEGKPGGGQGSSRRRRRPVYDDQEGEEAEEGEDDFYFKNGHWRRTEAGEARRREREARRRRWAEEDVLEDEEEEDGDDYVVRRRGRGNRPDFEWDAAGSGGRARGSASRGAGRGGRARRGWEDEGVLDASWSPYDDDESEAGGGSSSGGSRSRRGGAGSGSGRRYRRSHRRPEEEVEELVDRRFMGLEEDESTNDRSAAWIWYSPGSGGARARGGPDEEDADGEEKARQQGGKGSGAKKGTKKEEEKGKKKTSGGGFRWPWSRAEEEEEED